MVVLCKSPFSRHHILRSNIDPAVEGFPDSYKEKDIPSHFYHNRVTVAGLPTNQLLQSINPSSMTFHNLPLPPTTTCTSNALSLLYYPYTCGSMSSSRTRSISQMPAWLIKYPIFDFEFPLLLFPVVWVAKYLVLLLLRSDGWLLAARLYGE